MIDKTDREKDVSTVVGFIMEGHTRRDIIEWAASELNHSDNAQLYDDACDELLNAYRTARQHNKAFVVEGLKEMYRRLNEIGDYAGAAKVLVLVNKTMKG